MRRLGPLALLIVAVVVLGLWRTTPAEPVLQDGTPAFALLDLAPAPGSIEALRTRVAAVLERERVPGVAIALVDRDGVIWSGGVGVRDLEQRRAVDEHTVFRVASITKSFVGLGVMKLVEQGRLDLDQPLAEVLPDVAIDNPWHDVAPVTLAHALEHTAGFDDMRFNETFTDEEAMGVTQALAINPRSRIVRWRPGSRFAYSNVGYSVAARAIEVATGEPFDVWMRREVLAPLGMPDVDFQRTPALADRLATGHRGPDVAARFVPIAHRPAGALLASAHDLAQLVQFWLRRGEGFPAIVSPAGLDRIERNATVDYAPVDTGYGLGNYGDIAHPVRARGHDGGLPGFASTLRYFPELGVGYVVLLNATHSARAHLEIRRLVFSHLVAGRVLPPLPEIPETRPARPPADFFAFASPRHQLFGFLDRALTGWNVELAGDRLRFEPLIGRGVELVPTRDGGWRHPVQSGTAVRFVRSDDRDAMVVLGAYAEPGTHWLAQARLRALAIAVILLDLVPFFAIAVLGTAALRRRKPQAIGLFVWPAIAGLAFDVLPKLFVEAAGRELLGVLHPWTLAICGTTLVLAAASGAAMAEAVRWAVRPDRPGLGVRLLPSLAAIAAFGMTLWFGAHGLVGLRTWAW